MENIQFEGDRMETRPAANLSDSEQGVLVNFLIKGGVVKTKEQGFMVLVGIAAFLIILSVVLFVITTKKSAHESVPLDAIYSNN